MSWTLGGYQIYVEELKDSAEQIIADLQPISSGTIHHIFGWQKPVYTLAGTVVTTATKNSLRALTATGTTHVLSGDEGVLGSFYVKSVKVDRYKQPYQRIRSDLPVTTPVYKVTIELLED